LGFHRGALVDRVRCPALGCVGLGAPEAQCPGAPWGVTSGLAGDRRPVGDRRTSPMGEPTRAAGSGTTDPTVDVPQRADVRLPYRLLLPVPGAVRDILHHSAVLGGRARAECPPDRPSPAPALARAAHIRAGHPQPGATRRTSTGSPTGHALH